MRSIIQNTLKDLVKFLDDYKTGNKYDGPYNFFKGLALPHLIIPFTFFLMPNRDLTKATMSPNIEETIHILNEIIDCAVDSLNDMPRLESLLFQNSQEFDVSYYNLVKKDEEIVVSCKNRVKEIIEANSYGPQMLVLFKSIFVIFIA